MAVLTVQEVTPAGIQPVFDAADVAGDSFAVSDADLFTPHLLYVVNNSAGSLSAKIDDPTSDSPEGATAFDPDVTLTVPASDERVMRIMPQRFRDGSGNVDITYPGGVSSLTVAVFKVPNTYTP